MSSEWKMIELEAKMAKLTLEETSVDDSARNRDEPLVNQNREGMVDRHRTKGFACQLRKPSQLSRFEHLLYTIVIILSSLLGGVVFIFGPHTSQLYDEDAWKLSVAFSSAAANKSLCKRIQLDGGILREPSNLYLELCNFNHSQLASANIYDTMTLYNRSLPAPTLLHVWGWSDWVEMLHSLIRNLPPESCHEKVASRNGTTSCPIFVYPTSEIKLCLDRYHNLRRIEISNVMLSNIESKVFLMAIEAWVPDLFILTNSTIVL